MAQCRFEYNSGQLSTWNRKNVFQNEHHTYRQISTAHPWLTQNLRIQNIIVATDEGPNPKLILSEGGSRKNIES